MQHRAAVPSIGAILWLRAHCEGTHKHLVGWLPDVAAQGRKITATTTRLLLFTMVSSAAGQAGVAFALSAAALWRVQQRTWRYAEQA
jgi:hypothetical protein